MALAQVLFYRAELYRLSALLSARARLLSKGFLCFLGGVEGERGLEAVEGAPLLRGQEIGDTPLPPFTPSLPPLPSWLVRGSLFLVFFRLRFKERAFCNTEIRSNLASLFGR